MQHRLFNSATGYILNPESGTNIPILYEDNHLIVVVKPPNMPVCEDNSKDLDLLTLIRSYIKEKYNKPGNVYLGMVHRLDRPVGGVMVFAKTSKAAARLSEAFRVHSTTKRYMAVVCGEAQKHTKLTGYITSTVSNNMQRSRMCSQDAPEAKYAELSFSRAGLHRDATRPLSLLDITLQTGRKHQIRVQLSSENIPIWGDRRYNPHFFEAKADEGNIALFAYRLVFPHPTLKEKFTFTYRPPQDYPWSEFNYEISVLCAGFLPVYADNNILIIDKPKGIEVTREDARHRDGKEALSVEGMLEAYFPRVHAAHRLDATTSGLLVLAVNNSALAELKKLFSPNGRHDMQKIYSCTVLGKPETMKTELRHFMVRNKDSGYVRIYDKPVPGSLEVLMRYRVKKSIPMHDRNGGVIDVSELEVELITGRTHQIRAQLAHIGHPVIGDDKYGNREINRALNTRNVELSAVELVLNSPGGILEYLCNTRFVR